ncbi:MAG: hypothetical protein BGO78_00700 [Chloroflexi bacterium 44-23]|nr:MAG: hypothetical protein BGO78_00700 [Chloroflexi bacterium 44-23]
MSFHTTFEWTADEIKIFSQKWLPENKAVGKVIMVHGLGEHSMRYEHIAQFFNDLNIAFFAFDQRGHGKSSGKRGDIPSYSVACSDIDRMIGFANEEFPQIPTFLYGHSLGGAIVLYYGLTKTSPLTGIICTSPGLGSGEPLPAFKMFMAEILNKIMPTTTINNGLDVNNLSHDKSVVELYVNDPLVHPRISARLGMELISKGPWIVENANQLKYPLLLLQGGKDRLVSPPLTAQFAENAPQHLITYHLFPELYHEMHNEPENQEFLTTIKEWVELRLREVLPS